MKNSSAIFQLIIILLFIHFFNKYVYMLFDLEWLAFDEEAYIVAARTFLLNAYVTFTANDFCQWLAEL